MKKWISLLLMTALLMTALSVGAAAAEPEAGDNLWQEPETTEAAPDNQCGDDLTWRFSAGTLTIEGQGPMYDYPNGAPWDPYRSEIRHVALVGVTYVGSGAFRDYDALESVNLGTSLKEIGSYAFSSCDSLKTVDLPGSFRVTNS